MREAVVERQMKKFYLLASTYLYSTMGYSTMGFKVPAVDEADHVLEAQVGTK